MRKMDGIFMQAFFLIWLPDLPSTHFWIFSICQTAANGKTAPMMGITEQDLSIGGKPRFYLIQSAMLNTEQCHHAESVLK
jgi:hypothetical protein